MRLYLSSSGLGNASDRLLSLLRGKCRAAVIANAMDPYEDRGLETEFPALGEIGIDAEEIDLRDYFDTPDRTADVLAGFDLLWMRGGNVFALRQAMAKSRADAAIIELLKDDALIYGGYSAGPCVLAPSLRGLELCDDPAEVRRLYGEPVIFDGLGILDFAFVPHLDSPDHPETQALGRVVEHYRREGVPYRAFRDGEVLVIDGHDEILVQ
jgi:dipeptidase E